jgi:hypothetical protein
MFRLQLHPQWTTSLPGCRARVRRALQSLEGYTLATQGWQRSDLASLSDRPHNAMCHVRGRFADMRPTPPIP